MQKNKQIYGYNNSQFTGLREKWKARTSNAFYIKIQKKKSTGRLKTYKQTSKSNANQWLSLYPNCL